MPILRRVAASLLILSAAGCDQLGIESATALNGRKEADGKAVGGACRHAGRAIEDCYDLNKKADKAAIFAGWREMNDYMRENQIEVVPPAESATAVAAKGAVMSQSDAGADGGAVKKATKIEPLQKQDG